MLRAAERILEPLPKSWLHQRRLHELPPPVPPQARPQLRRRLQVLLPTCSPLARAARLMVTLTPFGRGMVSSCSSPNFRTLVGLQQKKVAACTASDRLPSTIARTLAGHVTDAVDQRGLAFTRTATKEDLLIRDDSAIIPSSTWAVVERSSPESTSIFAVDFL